MVSSTAPGSPRKVKDMVTYFEKQRDHPVKTTSSRKRRSMAAMMNLTRRPWEHFPRRKSSASTDRRRISSTSTSTRSNSTTYDPAEEYLSEPGYAASERSGTSTVVSDSRRRSENPDYDWEHDSIADLKASLKKLDLSPTTNGSPPKEGETANEIHVVDPSGVEESKFLINGTPGVHEIDFVDPSAPRTAEIQLRPEPTSDKIPALNDPAPDHAEASNSENPQPGIDEDELAAKSSVVESKASEAADSSQQFVEAKIPPRASSATGPGKAGLLRVKTSHSENDRKQIDSKSPNSPKSPKSPNTPSPKSKTRPKLAVDLPGIPESEAETMGRHHRRPSLSMIQPLPSQRQAVHVNRSSRPPVSMNRYPVRSISAPLPGQEQIYGPPTEMMQLVNQRQVKFNDIREEKLRRLSNISSAAGTSRPGSRMGRRHASAPVSDAGAARAAASTRKRQRRRSGPVRPSFVQRMSFSVHRFSISQRRQSVSAAIKEYIRSPRRRPSWLMVRTRSKTR